MVEGIAQPTGLSDIHAVAASEAIRFIAAYVDPPLGVLLGGSLARGEGDLLSDLDFYVVTSGAHRQRVQRSFSGVPCEFFFNPEHRIYRYFREEPVRGLCTSMALVLDSQVLLSKDDVIGRLRVAAREAIDAGPQVSSETMQLKSYLAVDTLDNAGDIEERDPMMARILAAVAVKEALCLAYLQERQWIPRDKDLNRDIATVCEAAAEPLSRFEEDPSPGNARLILTAILGRSTFFEWELPREEV